MPRFLLPLLFLPLPFTAGADTFTENFGTGVIDVDIDSIGAVDFWESPADKVPSHALVFYRDKNETRLHFRFDQLTPDSLPAWFSPLIFETGTGKHRLSFFCFDSTQLCYNTGVSTPEKKDLWIQCQPHVRRLDWLSFYKSVPGIEVAIGKTVLFETPGALEGRDLSAHTWGEMSPRMVVLDMDGWWMQVEFTTLGSNCRPIRTYRGWIRWRNEMQPVIAWGDESCE